MDPDAVRRLIEELLYSIIFTPDLTNDERIDSVAENIRTQRGFRHSAAAYSEAITTVLGDGHLPAEPFPGPVGHSEGDILRWLGRLGHRLNSDLETAPTE